MGTSKRKIDNKLFANDGAQSAGTERPRVRFIFLHGWGKPSHYYRRPRGWYLIQPLRGIVVAGLAPAMLSTLCSMQKNEPQRNAPYGLDKFFSLCYHYGTSLGA